MEVRRRPLARHCPACSHSAAPILLLAHLPLDRLIEAYAVLLVTSVYNAGVQYMMPRRLQWLANGYLSTISDVLLDRAMVIIGGGFDSPFYFILFTVTVAAAMRYGYGPSLGVALAGSTRAMGCSLQTSLCRSPSRRA